MLEKLCQPAFVQRISPAENETYGSESVEVMMTANFLLHGIIIILSISTIQSQNEPYKFETPLSASDFLEQHEATQGIEHFMTVSTFDILSTKSIYNLLVLFFAVFPTITLICQF